MYGIWNCAICISGIFPAIPPSVTPSPTFTLWLHEGSEVSKQRPCAFTIVCIFSCCFIYLECRSLISSQGELIVLSLCTWLCVSTYHIKQCFSSDFKLSDCVLKMSSQNKQDKNDRSGLHSLFQVFAGCCLCAKHSAVCAGDTEGSPPKMLEGTHFHHPPLPLIQSGA